MRLVIEISDSKYISSYLSALSIGILNCIENKKLTIDDAMKLLFIPGLIDVFKIDLPKLADAIHLGTELEDVESLLPHKLLESINDIKAINNNCIQLPVDDSQHVLYKLTNNN